MRAERNLVVLEIKRLAALGNVTFCVAYLPILNKAVASSL
jgi:hypothetical protein